MMDHDHLAEAMQSAKQPASNLYTGVYTIDSGKSQGFLSELVVLTNFGAINEIEIFTCDNCGRRGLDKEFYELRYVEPMTSEYPGHPGDLWCAQGTCL